MSDSHDDDTNVVPFGSGGKLYQDARDKTQQGAIDYARAVTDAEEMNLAPEDMAPDEPEPFTLKVNNGVRMQVGTIEAPKAPLDRRETISTALEIVGLTAFSVGCFLIHLWLGLMIAGLCLVLLGVATSKNFTG